MTYRHAEVRQAEVVQTVVGGRIVQDTACQNSKSPDNFIEKGLYTRLLLQED